MGSIAKFRLFFFVNFFANGVFMPFLGLYLFAQGLPGTQVAVILGLNPLVKMVAQPLWSLLSDRFHLCREVLGGSLMGLAAVSLLFPVQKPFWGWIALIVLFSILEAPYIPLGATVAVDYLRRQARTNEFGQLRMWGSLGFVIASLLVGNLLLDRLLLFIPLAFSVVALIAGLIVLTLPSPKDVPRLDWSVSRQIFRNNPGFCLLLVGIICAGFTSGVANQYFAVYMESIQSSGGLIGLAIALMALPEIPLMALASRLVQKFGIRLALLAGLAVIPLRFFFYYLLSNPVLILPVQLLQGVTIMSIHVVGVAYIAQVLPAELSATGQGLFAAAFGGAGMSIGLFSAGLLYESIGIHHIWLVCSLVGLLGFLIVNGSFILSAKRKRIAVGSVDEILRGNHDSWQ